MKPLLMIDIDGVLNLFGFDRIPEGAVGHYLEGFPAFLSEPAAERLKSLAPALFEPVWCSGWEERANDHLPYLLNLGPWPFLTFDRSPGLGAASRAHWKLDAIDTYAGARALAWVDDAMDDECHEWARERPAPTLLVETDPAVGLTSEHAEALSAWARGQGSGT